MERESAKKRNSYNDTIHAKKLQVIVCESKGNLNTNSTRQARLITKKIEGCKKNPHRHSNHLKLQRMDGAASKADVFIRNSIIEADSNSHPHTYRNNYQPSFPTTP